MTRLGVKATLVSVGAMIMGLIPVTAAVAVTGNDTVGSATVIGSLPFSQTEWTKAATADSDDPAGCGITTEGSVWFRFKASLAERLTVSPVGSDYGVNISVFSGRPTATSSPVGCGWSGPTDIITVPGGTYFIMLSRCCDTGPGFHLAVHLVRPPSITAAPMATRGAVRRVDGVAVVHGTIECSRGMDASLYVILTQRVSRTQLATGWGWVEVPACSPSATAWTIQVRPDGSVPFVQGQAAAALSAWGCDQLGSCSDTLAPDPVTLTLRWAK